MRGRFTTPDRIRTCDLRFRKPPTLSPNDSSGDDLRQDDVPLSAQTTALTAQNALTPDLAALVAAWPNLHEAVRAGIMAMVASGQKPE
jgi:hypothetical protein